MALADIAHQSSVLQAIAEYDEIGRDAFLMKYGFGKSKFYFLLFEGSRYDTKAILGAAHKYEFGVPLTPTDFSGGDRTAKKKLNQLGFSVSSPAPSFGNLTAELVSESISQFQELGQLEFLRLTKSMPSAKYFIVVDGQRIDAKPVLLHALRSLDEFKGLDSRDLPGTRDVVKTTLESLGFMVDDAFEKRYWQVNHNSTGIQSERLGLLYAPKRKKNGARSVYYENMTRVSVGDLVFSFRGSEITSVGVVTVSAQDSSNPFDTGVWDEDGYRIELKYFPLASPFRPQEYISQIEPLLTTENGPLKPDGTGVQGYLSEISSQLASLYLTLGETQEPFLEDSISPSTTYETSLLNLSAKINKSPEQVRQLVSSLTDKSPQIVFTGPPGTGKTYCAEFVARHVLGIDLDANDEEVGDRIKLVQFHPSYGYEDFVEGLRPEPSGDGFGFVEKPGKLVEMVNSISSDGLGRVLIIDEINRANLPRVFGELMFLLEYRDKRIDLMYQRDFSLPSNLYIIGTMNTADRSIGGIDLAMRRRFDFFEFPPDYSVIEKWYNSESKNELGSDLWLGLKKLNTAIQERMKSDAYSIGHSFFMDRHIDGIRLRIIWNQQIRPLIHEYFFDVPKTDLDGEFFVEKFWNV
jgi:AAA domain (dynein-related subfamily)